MVSSNLLISHNLKINGMYSFSLHFCFYLAFLVGNNENNTNNTLSFLTDNLKLYVGMFCRICRQHKQPVKRGPSKRVFIEVPSEMYRKDVIDGHMRSDHHIAAFQAHATLVKGKMKSYIRHTVCG